MDFLRKNSKATTTDLVDSLQHLKLDEKGSRKLYVDALNYGDTFFPLNDWNVYRAFNRVKDFVSACKKSKYDLTVFIDDTTPSEESDKTWRKRREKEIIKGEKNMPVSMSRMLGEMFSSCDIRVIYSDELDLDSTLASFAHADGADVLSNDKDLFRYTGASYRIFGNFTYGRGGIALEMKLPPERIPRRIPIQPKPRVRHSCLHLANGVYRRGVVTPLARKLNLDVHGVVSPLLRASLHRIGIAGPITETWPKWDAASNSATWHVASDIVPSTTPQLTALLQSPNDAVQFFFPVLEMPAGVSKRDWQKHVFGVRGLIYDICSTDELPMFRYWLDFEKKERDATKTIRHERDTTLGMQKVTK